MALDPTKNFAKVAVAGLHIAADVTIPLDPGEGSKIPDPAVSGAYNLVWWNNTDFADAEADTAQREIVRVTAIATDTLTVTRAQEGTGATDKNTSGKSYSMWLVPTQKTIDDIQTELDSVNADVQDGTVVYAVDTGVADVYAIALTPALTVYTAGNTFRVKILTTNLGASTLNVDSVGAVAIVKSGGAALEAGDLVAGDVVEFTHDGTSFQAKPVPTVLTQTDFIDAYDTTTQTVSIANTFQDITFSNNGVLDGWTHTATSADFTCPTTANYLVTYTAHGTKTTGSNSLVEVIALFNGVEIAGSQGGAFASVNNASQTISGSFIFAGTATQILKFQLTGATVNSDIVPPGGNAAVSPSISVSVVKV